MLVLEGQSIPLWSNRAGKRNKEGAVILKAYYSSISKQMFQKWETKTARESVSRGFTIWGMEKYQSDTHC